jgi:hypothetical protein
MPAPPSARPKMLKEASPEICLAPESLQPPRHESLRATKLARCYKAP